MKREWRPRCRVPVCLLVLACCVSGCGKKSSSSDGFRCMHILNMLVLMQQHYITEQRQKGRSEDFIRGTEVWCQPGNRPVAESDRRSDGSRVFLAFTKKGYLDDLSVLACLTDPFVAPLSGKTEDLQTVFDLPTERALGCSPFAAADSPAGTEIGHTFSSYSMQAGTKSWRSNVYPGMDRRVPLIAERNPWCVAAVLEMDESPTAGSTAGNAWNHGREKTGVGMSDGTVFFMDANSFELPEEPYGKGRAGFVYLYGDAAPGAAKVDKPQGKCVRPGDSAQTTNPWSVWMTD